MEEAIALEYVIGRLVEMVKQRKDEKMKIRYYPNSILRRKCKEVEPGDKKVLKLLDEMAQKLYEWDGVGLAAPQIGSLKRIVVIDVRDDPPVVYKMINPRIVWKSPNMVESQEGCLSLPGVSGVLMRHEMVTVEYLDENFEHQIIEKANGLLSRCLQHELDHLDGMLYIDRMDPVDRAILLEEYKQLQEENKQKQDIDSQITQILVEKSSE